MTAEPPRHTVAKIGQDWDWQQITRLSPFTRADGSGPARQQTKVRLCHDGRYLRVRFDCDDLVIWGNYEKRDDPIYLEEAVEVFIAPGADDPARYFEFEFSPDGVIWDGIISNPRLDGSGFQADVAWNCKGVQWQAVRNDAQHTWHVWLALPLKELCGGGEIPKQWRANFYRIDRPKNESNDALAEFSCWSPTYTSPASFHMPRHFGMLTLGEEDEQEDDNRR